MTDLELLEIWADPTEWGEETPTWDSLSNNQRTKTIQLIYELEAILGLKGEETDARSPEGEAQRQRILGVARKLFK